MNEIDKVKPLHLSRMALVYVRQSSAAQVEHNRESTLRQYALAQRAAALGWPQARITVIDDDLGLSGSSAHHRSGFARMAADVALGHVGLILGLEVSRLARVPSAEIPGVQRRRSPRSLIPICGTAPRRTWDVMVKI